MSSMHHHAASVFRLVLVTRNVTRLLGDIEVVHTAGIRCIRHATMSSTTSCNTRRCDIPSEFMSYQFLAKWSIRSTRNAAQIWWKTNQPLVVSPWRRNIHTHFTYCSQLPRRSTINFRGWWWKSDRLSYHRLWCIDTKPSPLSAESRWRSAAG